MHRLLQAIAAGALPFTCQGNLNGLAVEGGETLGYEIVADLAAAGGPSTASSCRSAAARSRAPASEALREAAALGAAPAAPRLAHGADRGRLAAPARLRRRRRPLRQHATPDEIREALAYAAHHRSEFMWPWEDEPHSIAHGILDDETYDWLAVVEGMLATGGSPLVVGEDTLAEANALALEATGIQVDATGSAGLAGLLALRASGGVSADERVAVLFTGAIRSHTPNGRNRR